MWFIVHHHASQAGGGLGSRVKASQVGGDMRVEGDVLIFLKCGMHAGIDPILRF